MITKLRQLMANAITSHRKRRDDKFRERIDRVYFRHGGDGSFDRYMEDHREEIVNAYNTINQVL